METHVINIGSMFFRQEYNNFEEWIRDDDNVYIGRAKAISVGNERLPRINSEWYNPYRITKESNYDKCLQKYKLYLIEKLKDDECKKRFLMLKGKNLGCWCKPKKCHGDIIKQLLDLM
jgi:hypothetical protein